ncbi:hypothetical protein Glove_535g10 [Diversispora epigaea]|uniref:Uncharacterized protein n=1 Tax=Diversispora epigaea TaxID=1348612 RepID=A0A397GLY4_9GLOM|nr:hypothetical protein Glove_535g10 [Diversispora epigaea]
MLDKKDIKKTRKGTTEEVYYDGDYDVNIFFSLLKHGFSAMQLVGDDAIQPFLPLFNTFVNVLKTIKKFADEIQQSVFRKILNAKAFDKNINEFEAVCKIHFTVAMYSEERREQESMFRRY